MSRIDGWTDSKVDYAIEGVCESQPRRLHGAFALVQRRNELGGRLWRGQPIADGYRTPNGGAICEWAVGARGVGGIR